MAKLRIAFFKGRIAGIAMACMLGGCSLLERENLPPPAPVPAPAPVAEAPAPAPAPSAGAPPSARMEFVENNRVPVLFATNRNVTGSAFPYYHFGNKLESENDPTAVQRGVALVRIPDQHVEGVISRAHWISLTIERLPNAPKTLRPDPKTHFTFAKPLTELSRPEFSHTLNKALLESESKSALLYVHGFANDFTDAAFRTAQISYDLARPGFDVVPIMFSWPSDPGLMGFMYPEAGKRVEDSAIALAGFLREIGETTSIGTVHIVAHSMGSRVLSLALKKLGDAELGVEQPNKLAPRFRQIVFAAADISPEFFREYLGPAIRTNHTVTSYVSSKDLAIFVSKYLNKTKPVGGDFEQLFDCVSTVDVTAEGKGIAHSTWAESPRVIADLRELLWRAKAPAARGLEPAAIRKTLWAIPKKPLASSAMVAEDTLKPCDLKVSG